MILHANNNCHHHKSTKVESWNKRILFIFITSHISSYSPAIEIPQALTSAPPSFLALTFSTLSLQPLPKPTLISLSLQSSPTFLRFVFSFRIGAVQGIPSITSASTFLLFLLGFDGRFVWFQTRVGIGFHRFGYLIDSLLFLGVLIWVPLSCCRLFLVFYCFICSVI